MSDLRGNFRHGDMKLGNSGKIMSAIIVAAAIGAAVTYAYAGGMSHSPVKQRVVSSDLPSPTPPGQRQ